MLTYYSSLRESLLAVLARHCEGRHTFHNAGAGLHVATLLPAGVDDVAVVKQMAARGLTAMALSTCYAGSRRRSGLILGFGGWGERRLVDATATLGEILRDFA